MVAAPRRRRRTASGGERLDGEHHVGRADRVGVDARARLDELLVGDQRVPARAGSTATS